MSVRSKKARRARRSAARREQQAKWRRFSRIIMRGGVLFVAPDVAAAMRADPRGAQLEGQYVEHQYLAPGTVLAADMRRRGLGRQVDLRIELPRSSFLSRWRAR